jgi:hypothetical protein
MMRRSLLFRLAKPRRYGTAVGGSGTAPVISGVPTIAGTLNEGDTLTATAASVTGDPSPTRTWQWLRDGVAISGATNATYDVHADDLDTELSVRQIETNASGSDTADSAAALVTNLIRVRRSSDSSETDIRQTIAGALDTTTLDTFAGAGDAFVTTWYDKSGSGNNATQATAASQPRIVSGGVVDENLVLDGSNDFLTLGTTLSFAGEFTLSIWAKRDVTSDSHNLFGANGHLNRYCYLNNNTTTIWIRVIGDFEQFSHGVTTTNWNHYAITRNSSGKVDVFINGVFVKRLFSDAAQVGTVTWDLIGTRFNTSNFQYHDGTLAHAYAADRALSEVEILALKNGTLPATGTVLYLKSQDIP